MSSSSVIDRNSKADIAVVEHLLPSIEEEEEEEGIYFFFRFSKSPKSSSIPSTIILFILFSRAKKYAAVLSERKRERERERERESVCVNKLVRGGGRRTFSLKRREESSSLHSFSFFIPPTREKTRRIDLIRGKERRSEKERDREIEKDRERGEEKMTDTWQLSAVASLVETSTRKFSSSYEN